MSSKFIICVAICLNIFFGQNISAQEDGWLLKMATCQDSWLDWDENSKKIDEFRKNVHLTFTKNEEGYFTPSREIDVLGHKVSYLYPNSVGMAVGFSIVVDGKLDAIKKDLENYLGMPFKDCADQGCEEKVGEKKTILLYQTEEYEGIKTMIACYYFYQK